MVVIDKAREYLRSIADSEEHYNYLLNNVWVNPTFNGRRVYIGRYKFKEDAVKALFVDGSTKSEKSRL